LVITRTSFFEEVSKKPELRFERKWHRRLAGIWQHGKENIWFLEIGKNFKSLSMTIVY
jgi:hypothetical protein